MFDTHRCVDKHYGRARELTDCNGYHEPIHGAQSEDRDTKRPDKFPQHDEGLAAVDNLALETRAEDGRITCQNARARKSNGELVIRRKGFCGM